jgi:hypothetical protein
MGMSTCSTLRLADEHELRKSECIVYYMSTITRTSHSNKAIGKLCFCCILPPINNKSYWNYIAGIVEKLSMQVCFRGTHGFRASDKREMPCSPFFFLHLDTPDILPGAQYNRTTTRCIILPSSRNPLWHCIFSLGPPLDLDLPLLIPA